MTATCIQAYKKFIVMGTPVFVRALACNLCMYVCGSRSTCVCVDINTSFSTYFVKCECSTLLSDDSK